MFERIVAALDGSEVSERVLAAIEPLIRRPVTELSIVRVVPKGERTADDEDSVAQNYLRALEERYRVRGIRAWVQVLSGEDPAAEVASFAARTGASLLCVGTHGRTGLARVALGSVAERIARAAVTPLLFVNPLVPDAPLDLGRIVIALDGSDRSDASCSLAAQLAKGFGSELILVHVESLTALTPLVLVAREQAATARTFERARALLEGARVRTVSRVGSPTEEILAAIAETGPGLVLMTTRGRTGLPRLAFGSVTEGVLRRSPVPVLVTRTTDAPPTGRV